MDKWRGKVALVTGAGGGIGAAITEQLVQQGMIVVGLDIREDRVKVLSERLSSAGSPGQLHAVRADLRKEEEILTAFAWVDDTLGGADVLVNNAGVLSTSKLSDGETDDWRAVLEVNVLGVAVCTREYLKSMERRNNDHGHIIIMSSVGAWVTQYAIAAMYQASKHAVKALAMCLRKELADRGSTIKVTCISPGRTKTGITGTSQPADIVAMDAEDIAAAAVHALSASPVTQMCEIIMTPVPTKFSVF